MKCGIIFVPGSQVVKINSWLGWKAQKSPGTASKSIKPKAVPGKRETWLPLVTGRSSQVDSYFWNVVMLCAGRE